MTTSVNAPTVLLIEDNADDAQLIVDGLARIVPREQIKVCADGGAALDFFHCRGDYAGRAPEELPAFVLLDLNLPIVGGFDVLRAIRAQASSRLLPVTIISASNRTDDVRTAAQLGANSFVHKPLERGRLNDTLSQLARYWMELNIPPPCCVQ